MPNLNFKMTSDFQCSYEDLPIGLFAYTNRERTFTELGFKSEYTDEMPYNTESGEYLHLKDDKTLIFIPVKIVATKPRKSTNSKQQRR